MYVSSFNGSEAWTPMEEVVDPQGGSPGLILSWGTAGCQCEDWE